MVHLDTLNRMFAPFRRRLDNMVARAVLRVVNDAPKMQEIQISLLDGETRDKCERFQNYGFSSNPLPGAEAAVVFVGGIRDHPLITAVDDRRHRPQDLAAGEVVFYTDEDGREGEHRVHFKRGKEIHLQAGPDNAARAILTPDLITLKLGATKIEIDEAGVRIYAPLVDFIKV